MRNNFYYETMATSFEVTKALNIDRANRRDGIQGGLIKLGHCTLRDGAGTNKVPTLVSPTRLVPKFDKQQFVQNFQKHAPELNGLDFSNLLVAGGFPCTLVTRPDDQELLESIDVDIFVYGLNMQRATARVAELVQHIFDEKAKQSMRFPVSVTQSSCAISIVVGTRKYQIIQRLYRTQSEILHCFDLGSSAIGYDGRDVYVTSLGKFAFEYGCNILDLTKRSKTYETRLRKYFQRGFSIILPDLNTYKLRYKYHKYGEAEIIEMPHMQVSYTALSECKNLIGVKKIYLKNGQKESDYEDWDGWNRTTVIEMNIGRLVRNQDPIYITWESTCGKQDALKVLQLTPLLDSRDITNHYQQIGKKIFKNGVFHYGLVEKYITVEKLSTIVTVLFSEKTTRESRKQYIDKLIEMQLVVVLDKFNKWKRTHHAVKNGAKVPIISWFRRSLKYDEKSGSNGAFHPLVISPEVWYGYFHRAPRAKPSTEPAARASTGAENEKTPAMPDTAQVPIIRAAETPFHKTLLKKFIERQRRDGK